MTILGIHIIDVVIVCVYLAAMLAIGRHLASKVSGQGDFYLAGRKLSPLMSFFLNFGNMTDANTAATTSSAVYREGAGGVWLSMQLLLVTPYYWFMNMWFRRVRLVTMGDLFEERFGSRFLPSLYAGFYVLVGCVIVGMGFLISYKTMDGLLLKPESEYTAQEERMVERYETYVELEKQYKAGELESESKIERYEMLSDMVKTGELKSHPSYIAQVPFYIGYGLVVGIYVMLGGMAAAVLTDAVQGVLIIAFSIVMVPLGLYELGGFSGLHEAVPDNMFNLAGSGIGSEFAWHSIALLIIITLVQINGIPGNMAVGGSARNEFSARMGAVSGGFMKRFMTIAWAFCGLIALGIFGQGISDSDLTWGLLSRELLGPGLLGLMFAGILAANMSTLDAWSLFISALFTRNLYMPLFPGRSERHYVWVGRLSIAFALIVGGAIGMAMNDAVSLGLTILTLNVTFGAPVLLIFKWRRITREATIIATVFSLVTIVLAPNFVPFVPGFRTIDALTEQSVEHRVTEKKSATAEDVAEGRAESEGETIRDVKVIAPRALFFEEVARENPGDPESELEGIGRFHIENFILDRLGVPVHRFTPAGLMTSRFAFDVVVPFLILFVVSWLTPRTERWRTERFYARMQTPVAPTPEEDEAEVERSYADPRRFEGRRLFKNSNWEFYKPNRQDVVGFIACCAVAAFILGFFFWLLGVGAN